MLFAYAEPIGADKLAQALQLPAASVESALEALHERCQREDSGLCLLHLNTHWQLATKTEFAECVRRVLDTRRSIPLGPAAMETLTVIAYNQPVSRAFIEQVRGVDSSSSVSGLLEKGLIKGGSLENAVVIRGEELMSKEPMRFINEFARHKAMDLIGDLTLCGKPILGHVIAIKPGHGPNTELTAKLKKEHHRNQQMAPNPVNVPYGDAVLDINEVMSLLPHRYPFLMVDRIIGFEGETKCRGLKNLTMNELFFQGHFPGHPVMPGVLQVEAMAQVASIVMLRQPGNASKLGYFMSADKVKFRRVVVPGDTLIIEAELTKMRGNIGQATARCLVNGHALSK